MQLLESKITEEKPKKRARNFRSKSKQKAQSLKCIHSYQDAVMLEDEIYKTLND